MTRVSIYTTALCPYCRSAKALLQRLGIRYDEIELSSDSDAREQLQELTGRMSFPQVVIDGEPVGGYRELAALASGRELNHLVLKAARTRTTGRPRVSPQQCQRHERHVAHPVAPRGHIADP